MAAELALEPRPYRPWAVPRIYTAGEGALSVIHPGDAPRVSVIIAAWDEEESLGYVLPRLPRGLYEVILVDGNSTDRTVETALELLPDIKIVTQPGKGKGDALRAGFAAARGDIVIAIDADGSTDPIEIPAFVGALLAGADYVKGSRFIPGGGTDDMTFTRKMGNLGLMIAVPHPVRHALHRPQLRLHRLLAARAQATRPAFRGLRDRDRDEHPRRTRGAQGRRGRKLRRSASGRNGPPRPAEGRVAGAHGDSPPACPARSLPPSTPSARRAHRRSSGPDGRRVSV